MYSHPHLTIHYHLFSQFLDVESPAHVHGNIREMIEKPRSETTIGNLFTVCGPEIPGTYHSRV